MTKIIETLCDKEGGFGIIVVFLICSLLAIISVCVTVHNCHRNHLEHELMIMRTVAEHSPLKVQEWLAKR
jgi:hypothetical protein